jgi:hypothetical protein
VLSAAVEARALARRELMALAGDGKRLGLLLAAAGVILVAV